MRKTLIVSSCIVICALLCGGCQEPVRAKPVNVIIEGSDEFAEFIVGTWRESKKKWEFVFEPDGTISSAVIDSGFIKVKPSEPVAVIPTRKGGKAIYELGQWSVRYSPESHELAVKVIVDHFHIDSKPINLKNKSKEIL